MIASPFVSMREALSRPEYFGGQLGAPSWAHWRVLLISIAGERLTAEELVEFKELTGGREAPSGPVREFWGVIGRRGGKSRAIAVLACWLAACHDYRPVLAPGQRALLPILAQTSQQAGEILNYAIGAFQSSPALKGLVSNVTSDTLSLSSRIDIAVRVASFRSARGSTAIAAICDEVAFWRSDEISANPDTEILRALRPSLATTKGQLIAISSPYARRGELWRNYQKYFSRDSAVLVAQAASEVMNDQLDRDWLAQQFADDPVAAAAEYGAEFRSDLAAFVSIDVLDACVASGVREIPPFPGESYFAFVDPSGGSSDSMTLAICHKEGDRVLLDCVRERVAPFSPESVVGEFCETLKAYGVHRVRGDRYAGEWPREQFDKRGIRYELSEHPKSDIYLNVLPSLNAGRCQLLDHKRLLQQLAALERRTARGGKDSIDHPRGGRDDVANAAAGALLMALDKSRGAWLCIPGLIRMADGGYVYNLQPLLPLPERDSSYMNVYSSRPSFNAPGWNDYNGGARSDDPFEPRMIDV